MPAPKVLRTYGIGAQILRDLGVTRMRVLSAPKQMHGLSGFDLEVVEYVDGYGRRPGPAGMTEVTSLAVAADPTARQLRCAPWIIKTLEGDLQCRELRFAILASRFNEFIVDQLVRGAVDTLRRHGASDKQIEIVRAPGAFDLPLVARKLALSKRYDAIIALGAVIKGATAHFDYVAGECAGGLARVAQRNRRSGRFRRADHRHDRAGDRACRHQGRQQGRRCRRHRYRAGEPAAQDRGLKEPVTTPWRVVQRLPRIMTRLPSTERPAARARAPSRASWRCRRCISGS